MNFPALSHYSALPLGAVHSVEQRVEEYRSEFDEGTGRSDPAASVAPAQERAVSNAPNALSVTRTLRLKVKREAYSWLNAAAIEVNRVFNWCNATSIDAADRNRRANAKFLSGFELCSLSAGATEYFERIGSDTIQRICCEYAVKRRAAKAVRLRWRVSRGARRSLGWVPFKAQSLKRKGVGLRFAGKTFRVFDRDYLGELKWRDGCFAQDACGDWWLCLPVIESIEPAAAPREAVGIDLGLKDIAVTSDGERLEAGRWTQAHAERLANAQRRGHRRQAKRIHRKAARCRADALHKFSRGIVDRYQRVVIGEVDSIKQAQGEKSTPRVARRRVATAVYDSGWGMLRQMLQYKGEHAGRSVKVVSEQDTTRVCGNCGALTGPEGVGQLVVRRWMCSDCGESHDRDVNAARNILRRAEVSASVRGNESLPTSARRAGHHRPRETGISAKAVAA